MPDAAKWRRTAIILIVVGAALGLAQCQAQARPLSCDWVRYYVDKYGAERALQWAKDQGWSDADIQRARQCLKKKR